MSPGVPQLDGRFLRRDLTRNPWIWRTTAATFAMFAAAVFGLRFALPDVQPIPMYALVVALAIWSVILFATRAPAPGSAWAHAVVASTYVGPALAMLAMAPHGVIGVPSALFAGPLIGTWMTRLRDTGAHLAAATLALLAPTLTGLVDINTFLGAISLIPAMWVVTFCIVVVMGGVEEQGEHLDALIRVDPLTGVGNRRRLDELLDALTTRVDEGGAGFAVVTLDLDGFKSVNDQLGHDAGDALLQHVAATLRDTVGAGDVVVRQGGDEFAVVIDSVSEVDVAATVRRIGEGLADLETVAGVPVSAGIGQAFCPADGSVGNALLAAADARLLRNKIDATRQRAEGAVPPDVALTIARVAQDGEATGAFSNGIGRRELERDQVIWTAHAAMYLIYAVMGLAVHVVAPEVTGRWFPFVASYGGAVGLAYLVCGPPRIGSVVNHFVVSQTYVVPALILWSCAPGGSYAVGTLLFVGPLASSRFVNRWDVAVHVGAATVLVLGVTGLVRHDVWTILAILQTLPVIVILAACCVIVLELAERQTLDLHRLVRRDPLTGLANRRLLLEELGARAESGTAFAVVTFDLNGFKHLNDTVGHGAGDELLCAVANCLTTTAGPDACVARQGGDEFAVIHPAQTTIEVEAVAAGLRHELARLQCAGAPLTTGIGWAIAPADGDDPSSLLNAADRRLLADKALGRRAEHVRNASSESRLTA